MAGSDHITLLGLICLALIVLLIVVLVIMASGGAEGAAGGMEAADVSDPVVEVQSPPLRTSTHRCPSGLHVEVVRDDMLPFGTKQRAVPAYMEHAKAAYPEAKTLLYTGGFNGYGPAVTALAAYQSGMKSHIVYSLKPVGGDKVVDEKQARKASPVKKAISLGAEVEFHSDWKSVVSRGQELEEKHGSGIFWLPLGILDSAFVNALKCAIIKAKQEKWPGDTGPPRMWVVGGVGAVASALAGAFPKTQIMVVPATPGGKPLHNLKRQLRHYPNAQVYMLKRYKTRRKGKTPRVPYSTVQGYDSLAWEGVCEAGKEGDALWNVAA